MLSGKEIERRLGTDIIINPFNKDQLNPNSYNVTLNEKLKVYTNKEYVHPGDKDQVVLYVDRENPYKEIIIPDNGFLLKPNTLYIGRTNEYTETNNLVPCISGRSSIGRLGICVHVTAGFGDIGFKGTWTLEITCVHPVWIKKNMKIGQIYYETVDGEIGNTYHGKYLGQVDAETSRIFNEYK